MRRETERERYRNEINGFKVHATISVLVIALLIIINVVFVSQFLWFIFPLIGMSIALAAHFIFRVWFNRPTETRS
jgi:hypothetical protein